MSFRGLGRSGLILSPPSLGAMTLGRTNWGATNAYASTSFHTYVEACGNFIGTADVYADARSEELVGGYIENVKLRGRLVVATTVEGRCS